MINEGYEFTVRGHAIDIYLNTYLIIEPSVRFVDTYLHVRVTDRLLNNLVTFV